MSEADGAKVGPVFAYTDRRAEVERFYRGVLGLGARSDDAEAAWLETANADLVVRGRAHREAPREVAAATGFVVWFGVPHVDEAWKRARDAGSAVGDFYGDYFFARDPDGRYVGVYEEHGHDHDH